MGDWHLSSPEETKMALLRKKWGQNPQTEQDVFNVFAAYCKGEIGMIIPSSMFRSF